MRQSSESFMDKMLEDNSSRVQSPDISKQIGDILDKKLEQAMERFNEEVSKVNKPIEDTKEVTENEVENDTKEVIENEESTGEQENE